MYSTKFTRILKELSPDDIKSFEKWLVSPWCNSNKSLVRLLQKLKKYAPNFDQPNLTKERLYRQVFPKKIYNDSYMDNLMSEANDQIEKFLSFQSFNANENSRKKHLNSALQDRHLEKQFFKSSSEEIERLENKSIKTWEDYISLLKAYRQVYHHPNQNPRMQPDNATILKINKNLEFSYLLEKAAVLNEQISRNRILKGKQMPVQKDIKRWKSAAKNIDHIAVNFYRRRFEFSNKNRLIQFHLLKKDFLENFENLNEKDRKVHLFALLNDATILRAKKLVDLSEIMPLYKIGLTAQILIEKGVLNRIHYVAIISGSNFIQDFEFTDFFIEKYTSYLPKEVRQDGRQYGMAHLANRRKKLKICKKILDSHKFTTHYFQLAKRILELQNHFDLFLGDISSIDCLESYCSAFEKWLEREKIRSKGNKEPFFNFIRKTRELIKLNIAPELDEQKAAKFLSGKINVQPINWLFQKRDEIVVKKKK